MTKNDMDDWQPPYAAQMVGINTPWTWREWFRWLWSLVQR